MYRSLLTCGALVAGSGTVRGEEANTSLVRTSAPATSFFAVDEPALVPPRELHVGATLDAGSRLLVLRDPQTGMVAPQGEAVRGRLALHLFAAAGVTERIELGVGVSTALQSGDASPFRPAVRAAALGDLRARGKLHLLRSGRFALAGIVELALPTASAEALFGEPALTLTPSLAGGTRVRRLELSAQLGYRLRDAGGYADLVVDDEVVGGVGARLRVRDGVWLQAELFGAYGVQGRGNQLERPLELVAGARARIAGPWLAQAGVGFGVTRGYGTPDARGLFMIGYAPSPAPLRRATAVWTPPEMPEERGGASVREAPGEQEAPDDTDRVTLVGDRIVLPASVLFELDAADLTPEGEAALARVRQLLIEHPEWATLAIEGHTDVRGRPAANQRLSEQRAEAVRDHLLSLGIARDRLQAIGHGESNPVVVDATSEADHAKNRRVELVIIRRRVVE